MGGDIHRGSTRLFWAVVSCVAIVIFFLFVLRAPKHKVSLIGEGNALEFSLFDMNGKEVSSSHFKGKIVILNFWATWCPPCVAEMPALNKIFHEYQQKGVVVLGVNAGESEEKVKPFVKKLGISFNILMDEERTLENKYKVIGIPTTFFIGRNGVVKDLLVGGASYSIFKKRVEEIL
ncbi:MAG: TlpA family protein disulfide reductase [Nitrospinota bacterium]